MAKRKHANSVKNSRWWKKLSHDGMTPYLVGAKFKGMGKSNIRKLSRRLTRRSPGALRLGQIFNPYDLEHIAQIDEIVKRRQVIQTVGRFM